jgi:hypothetical protein
MPRCGGRKANEPIWPGIPGNSGAEGFLGMADASRRCCPIRDIGEMTVNRCAATLIVVAAAGVLLSAATAHLRRQPT